MNAPLFYFMSLDRQFDGGFGVIGEAFKEAGDEMAKVESAQRRPYAHLPISYLYRHAIELYLKSMIFTIHRAFEMPLNQDSDPPLVRSDGKWKQFDTVHNLCGLWTCLHTLMERHKGRLDEVSVTDWTGLEQCDTWIKTIDAADPSGTLLKYPTSRNKSADREKTSFKNISDELLTKLRSSDSYGKGSLIEDLEGSTEIYMLDYSPINEIRGAISKCVEVLSAAHFAMRCELGDGA